MKKTKITLLLFVIVIMAFNSSAPVYSQDENNAAANRRYGPDSLTCLTNISVYRESFRQWKAGNYQNESVKDAIDPWRWVFLNCPEGSQNTYTEGARIMSYMIETAPNEDLRNNYIDTLMMIYNQRITYFGREGYVLGRKGMDLSTYRPEDSKQICMDLERSVKLEGNNSAGPVLICYLKTIDRMVQNGEADSAVLFGAYFNCINIIDHNLKIITNNPDETDNWKIIKHNVELIFNPYATCNSLASFFIKKSGEKPADINVLNKLADLLVENKCPTDSLIFLTTRYLYEQEPSPSIANLVGKMLMNEGNYTEAIDYFKEGEKLEDLSVMQESCKNIAKCYVALQNYSNARTFALKALTVNPNDGEACIMIGDMYVLALWDCGDNDLSRRAVYWAAVDKYIKARQVDPSIAEVADKRISVYSAHFPSKEIIFSRGLKEGDTYKLDCWINEETTVRSSN